MPRSLNEALPWERLAPLLSGVLWALCFPKTDWTLLSWAALAPLCWFLYRAGGTAAPGSAGTEGRPPRQSGSWTRAAAWSFAAGWVYYALLMSWIYTTCRTAGVAAPVSLLAVLGLAMAMAVQWALFGAGFALFERVLGFAPPVLVGAWWTALEWAWGRWLTQFPWGLAGYTRWRSDWVLPAAAATGVWGLSFLVVQANAALGAAAAGRRRSFQVWGAPVLVVLAFFILGRALGGRPAAGGGEVRVSVLQGGVDQYKKWDQDYVREILDGYRSLAGLAGRTDLVVWPESALPGWLEDPGMLPWLSALVRSTHAFHLVGVVTQEGGVPRNSALLVSPDGAAAGSYHKRQLVPFGERVPLQDLLGRWVPVLGELGGMSAGESGQAPLRVLWGSVSASICYEAIFPDLMRASSQEGARLLVNLTNDGWYLDTAGPYQHFAMSVLRAAENRAYLLRAANTGISALVDPWGRVAARTRLGEKTVMSASFSMDAARSAPSFYARFGDLFPALCLACCLSVLGLGAWERKA